MQRRHPSYTLLSKAVLIGVYFIFFAVQLHFRYAFLSFGPFATQEAVVQQGDPPAKQVKSVGQQVHAAKQEAKLNKRYHPQTVFEALPAAETPRQAYTTVQQHVPLIASTLHSIAIVHSLQRGPPCNI